MRTIVKSVKIGRRHVALRHPVWDDAEAFIDCLNRLYRESRKRALYIPIDKISGDAGYDKFSLILKKIALGKMFYLMVEFDGRVEGQGWIEFLSGQFGEGYCRLGIQLTRKCRGLGIGRLLMGLLETRARERQMKGILLDVAARNPALKLYREIGFVTIAARPFFMGTNLREPFFERADLIGMLKPLDPKVARYLKRFENAFAMDRAGDRNGKDMR